MVKAMIMLDSEGKRITVKYYTKEWASSVKEQSNFERSLFLKTARTNARGEGKDARMEKAVALSFLPRVSTGPQTGGKHTKENKTKNFSFWPPLPPVFHSLKSLDRGERERERE